MKNLHLAGLRLAPSLHMGCLAILFGALWLAGGASQADELGQVVVRGTAWVLLIGITLAGARPSFRETRPVAILLFASVLLVLLQLVPLPPGIWQDLPGREPIIKAAIISGQAQPWRPLSMVPWATLNAASSLIVPVATLVLLGGLREKERLWLPGMLLTFILLADFVGLMQFSGIALDNPFSNEIIGQVSGPFANRNHFALLLAIGCLLAPAWAFLGGRRPGWRGPIALGLVLLFAITILASGSRAGMILGLLAILTGMILAWRGIRNELHGRPRWVFPVLILAIVGIIAIFVLISIASERAVSITRAIEIDPSQDMRSRGLPVVFSMVQAYFPMGSGFGGFDSLFRMHEPFELLKPTYFNHAHDDLVEIVLDGGLPGLVLLLCGLSWWAVASFRAWRSGLSLRWGTPKMGSAILLLVIIASAFDYPARTPIIMAVIVIAGVWLSSASSRESPAAFTGE